MNPRAFFMAAALALCACTARAAATQQRAATPSKNGAACEVGGVKFTCPAGFEPVSGPPEETPPAGGVVDSVRFFLKQGPKVVLFIAVPEPGETEGELTTRLVTDSVKTLLPGEVEGFHVNGLSTRPRPRASRFEVSAHALRFRTPNAVAAVKIRYVVQAGRAFAVGYAFEAGRGAEAERAFRRKAEPDLPQACNAALQLVRSVTGEPSRGSCGPRAAAPRRVNK